MNTDKLTQMVKEYEAIENANREKELLRAEKRLKRALDRTEKLWKNAVSKELMDALEQAGFTYKPEKSEYSDELYIALTFGSETHNQTLYFQVYEDQTVFWMDNEYDLSSREGELKLAAEIAFQFKIN